MSNLNNVSARASALADTIDWGVIPKAGVCSLYLGHVRDNVCAGRADLYERVLDWMAFAVQRPDDLPGVAIALVGAAGTGKGLFVTHFGALFGDRFAHIVQLDQLVGRFNGHLAEAVLVFADELFLAGNKRYEAAIKVIISEPVRVLERKYADVVLVKNRTHLIAASNSDWAIPADQARRWLVLSVGDARQNDHAYFSAIDHEMHHGGREALLHMLLHRDLTGVDLHDAPMTAEA
jgi:hypothetical protein